MVFNIRGLRQLLLPAQTFKGLKKKYKMSLATFYKNMPHLLAQNVQKLFHVLFFLLTHYLFLAILVFDFLFQKVT